MTVRVIMFSRILNPATGWRILKITGELRRCGLPILSRFDFSAVRNSGISSGQ